MDVLKALKNQIGCLEKFLNYSQNFLLKATEEALPDLESFQNTREVLLKAFDEYDRKISQSASLLTASEKTSSLISQVRQLLELKESLTKMIIEIDFKIISHLENEKNQLTLAMNLTLSDRNHQLVKKFKSTWISQSGETLDGKI